LKRIVIFALILMMLVGLAAPAFAATPLDTSNMDTAYYSRFKDAGITINVFNWGEYISDGRDGSVDINAEFEALTGIKVNYNMFESNEAMYAKLKGGSVSYDVVIPSDYMISQMIAEDMLLPLDFSNIPNADNVDPKFLNMTYDPENLYTLPYTWGTVVIIYNTTMVDPDEDVETWDILWNEKYAGQILMFDNPRDAYGIALKKAGHSLNPASVSEVEEATELLKAQNKLVQTYVMDQIFDKMAAGEAAVGPYYAGDFITMQNDNPDLAAAYPREGTNIFVDCMVIPTSAKQKEAAEMYINFMLEPEVGLANTEYIGYSTPNLATLALLDEETTGNPITYPPSETMEKAEFFLDLPQEVKLAMDNGWSTFRNDDEAFNFWLMPVLVVVALAAVAMMGIGRSRKKKVEY
jgi:spermidine/putrescine transport system substrate-binding protein